jgi:hypothetical protein
MDLECFTIALKYYAELQTTTDARKKRRHRLGVELRAH